MNNLSLLFLLCIGMHSAQQVYAQSETHRVNAPMTDYPVTRLVHSEGYTLIGGFFNNVGAHSGSDLFTDPVTGAEDQGWPRIAGEIHAVVPDGNGGWYLGGNFWGIDNQECGNLVHFNADKTWDKTFNPDPWGVVRALAVRDDILYAGGNFTTIAGQPRGYASAIRISSGALTAWNPAANGTVTAIEAGPAQIFIAGSFTQVGGQNRQHAAAVDMTTGAPIAGWQLTLGGISPAILAMKAADNELFVGGVFTTVNGAARAGLAAVSLADGTVNPTWNPDPQSAGTAVIRSLALAGSTLFFGGHFELGIAQDAAMANLAAVSTTGAGTPLEAFTPVFEPSARINSMSLQGNTLFIAGYFSTVNNATRYGVCGLNITNGTLTDFAPNPHGATVNTVAATGTRVLIAGDLLGVNWRNASDLTLMVEDTGQLWPHEVTLADGEEILDMVVIGNTLYIGGRFSEVNGISRKNLAALDLTTGAVLPWNPGAGGSTASFDASGVFALANKDNIIYAGGIFHTVGGQTRRGLAAIDGGTGAVTAWAPVVGDGTTTTEYVLSMHIAGNALYVGGDFALLGGRPRSFAGAIDLATAEVLPFDPAPDDAVRKIRVAGSTAYLLGPFTSIGGATRNGFAAVDVGTSAATAWDPQFSSSGIEDFDVTGEDLYVGSYFASVGTQERPGIASFSLATGELNNWVPDVGTTIEVGYIVHAVAVSPRRIYVGGGFTNVGRTSRTYYAEYDACATAASVALEGIALRASAGDSYQWYENGALVAGATSQTYEINPVEYGVYAVQVTANGCTARSADFTYLVTGTEGPAQATTAFPVPARDAVFIDVRARATARVHDITGKPVAQLELSPGDANTLDISAWREGTYLIRVESAGTVEVVRIIKTY